MDEFKAVMTLIIVGVFTIGGVILGACALDQRTDSRIERMIKSGVDPGKAYCSMRFSRENGCQIILKEKL